MVFPYLFSLFPATSVNNMSSSHAALTLVIITCSVICSFRPVCGQTFVARTHSSSTSSSFSSDSPPDHSVHIECNSNNIMVTLRSPNFNGMIYPKGLSTNSSCMVEYKHVDSVTYLLPLRACNTMSADVVSILFYSFLFVLQNTD